MLYPLRLLLKRPSQTQMRFSLEAIPIFLHLRNSRFYYWTAGIAVLFGVLQAVDFCLRRLYFSRSAFTLGTCNNAHTLRFSIANRTVGSENVRNVAKLVHLHAATDSAPRRNRIKR